MDMPVRQGSERRTAWQDEMSETLVTNGMPAADARAWAQAVPFRFAAAHAPDDAGRDVGSLLAPAPSARWADIGGATVLRLAWADRPSLSHVIAVLDRLGVQVDNHTEWQLAGPDGRTHRLDDFAVGINDVSGSGAGSRLLKTLMAVLSGRADDDGFNRLVLEAGLEWRQVVWVRCWYRYLRQTGFPLGLTYVQEALTRHPAAIGGTGSRSFVVIERDVVILIQRGGLQLAARVDRIEIAGPVRRHHNNTLRAWDSLPVRLRLT